MPCPIEVRFLTDSLCRVPVRDFLAAIGKYWRRLEHSRISPLVNRRRLNHLFVFCATNPKLVLVRLKIMLTTHVQV
jgi:hypothetical protein